VSKSCKDGLRPGKGTPEAKWAPRRDLNVSEKIKYHTLTGIRTPGLIIRILLKIVLHCSVQDDVTFWSYQRRKVDGC